MRTHPVITIGAILHEDALFVPHKEFAPEFRKRLARLTASRPGVAPGALYARPRRIYLGLKDSTERTLDDQDRSETLTL
jgi:hypothetical protein